MYDFHLSYVHLLVTTITYITLCLKHPLWNNVQFHYCMLTFIITTIICWIRAASHKFVHPLSSLLISLITLLSSLQVSPSLLSILVSCLSSLLSLTKLRLTDVDMSSYFLQTGPVSKMRTESLMAADNTGQSHISDSNSFVTIWIWRKLRMTYFCKLHISF